jgi:succinate dehydrogenase / fumarate reductase cytochrome b subunit
MVILWGLCWEKLKLMQERPISPHLQIYKWQLTSVLSILHRVTGIVLSGALIGISLWLHGLAWDASFYQSLSSFFNSWFGKIMIGGWVFSFYYHLCNGIRHLGWDLGVGLELRQAYRSGWSVVFISSILTFSTYCIIWGQGLLFHKG